MMIKYPLILISNIIGSFELRYRSHNLGKQGTNTAACIAAIPEETTILDLGCCDFNVKNCLGSPPDLAQVFAAIPSNVEVLILIHNFSLKGRNSLKNGSETRSFAEWPLALSALPKTIKKIEFHIDDISTWSKLQCREIGRALSFDIEFSVVNDAGQQVEHPLIDEIKRHIGAVFKESQANQLFKFIPLPKDLVGIIYEYLPPNSLEEVQTVPVGSLKFKFMAAFVFMAPLITIMALSGECVEEQALQFMGV